MSTTRPELHNFILSLTSRCNKGVVTFVLGYLLLFCDVGCVWINYLIHASNKYRWCCWEQLLGFTALWILLQYLLSQDSWGCLSQWHWAASVSVFYSEGWVAKAGRTNLNGDKWLFYPQINLPAALHFIPSPMVLSCPTSFVRNYCNNEYST